MKVFVVMERLGYSAVKDLYAVFDTEPKAEHTARDLINQHMSNHEQSGLYAPGQWKTIVEKPDSPVIHSKYTLFRITTHNIVECMQVIIYCKTLL